MHNLFPAMADKKKLRTPIAAIMLKKVFMAFVLPFVLFPGYTSCSSNADLNRLPNLQKSPHHIGIIMDGNGRWGVKAIGDRSYGHKNSKKAVIEAITACLEQGISYLTLYAFSTENWNRPEQEIDTIFKVITEGITEHIDLLTEHDVRFRVVGETKGIPGFCWNTLKKAIDLTKNNTKLHLTVALNYGGQAEAVAASEAIVNAFLRKIVNEFLNKGFNNNSRFEAFIKFAHDYRAKITPTTYKKYLHTSELPDVDLLIRTGGKKRISNFLPWQCAYAELSFTDLKWPDFRKKDLIEAIVFFQKQQRNFGGIRCQQK